MPPTEIRRLRVITRYRNKLIRMRGSEVQRVEKVLEDAVIKIGSVASQTLTKSGRAMIEALIAGERDPEVLADLAMTRLRTKIPDLMRALDGHFDQHHAVQLRGLLDQIDWFEQAICDVDDRVIQLTAPWHELIDRLCTIPGVGQRTAQVIGTETGADMSVFATHQHLASWAGLCLGHNESGGKNRSGRTTPGDAALRRMTQTKDPAAAAAAQPASRRVDLTRLQSRYRRTIHMSALHAG